MFAAKQQKETTQHLRTVRDLLSVVEAEPGGKRIVHFHTSRLPARQVDGKKLRKAIDFIRSSVDKLGIGDVTIAPNRDIIAWAQGIKLANIISICRKIENYFCEEQDFATKNFYGDVYFYTVIDPSFELAKFRTFAISMIEFGMTPTQKEEKPKEPISIENFSKIIDVVQRSDMTAFVFNQPIYNIRHPKTSIEFIEFYVGMKNFEDTLCPEYSIMADAWLFNRLTEEFDRAVLRHVHQHMPEYRHKAFSLNLNLKSVFCREFAVFTDDIPAVRSGRVILEINKLSMLSNWALFEEVCALAKQKNLKICIDGMEVRDFANLHLANLDFDFIKLKWSAAMFSEKRHLERAVRSMAEIDRQKIVLSMCDSDEAFAFARAAGIGFVQGRLADKYFKHALPI